jgi:esterase/lipase
MKQHIYSSVYKNQSFPDTFQYFSSTEIIQIKAKDGMKSLLYLFPSSTNPNSILFYFHGNGDPKWRLLMLQKIRQRFDCTIAFPVYRGHDLSLEKHKPPTESGIVKDVDACFAVMKDRGILKHDSVLLFYGLSLGGGIMSSYLAKHCRDLNPKPSKIILDTTFTSMCDVFQYYQREQDLSSYIRVGNTRASNLLAKMVKYLPITPFIWLYLWFNDDLYNSSKHLRIVFKKFKLKCPVLILGATLDNVTPVEMSRALVKTIYKASDGTCKPDMVEMECNHGCCTDVDGFYVLVHDFLSK